ncbi:MAG: hypothetical protein AB4352_16660 [Hormoscilla sp.]
MHNSLSSYLHLSPDRPLADDRRARLLDEYNYSSYNYKSWRQILLMFVPSQRRQRLETRDKVFSRF